MLSKEVKPFIQFILASSSTTKQRRYILFNCSLKQLEVIAEILHNLLENIKTFSKSIQKQITKKKTLIKKFVSNFKNKSKLRKLLKKHITTVLRILLIVKDNLVKIL